MVRYYEGSHTFSYDWDQVARAYWCRYPNPFSKHVLSEDVVQRFVDSSGKLWSKRLLSKTNRVPKWTERFISHRSVYVVEEAMVDPVNKILTTYTRNIGLQSFLTIEEKVTYTVSPESKEWTVAERKAWVNSNMSGISRAVSAFGMERFRHNVVKACSGFQFVLDAMFSPPETNNIDHSTPLHPLLRDRLKEKAKNLSEAAKAKAKVPLVTVVMSEERQ